MRPKNAPTWAYAHLLFGQDAFVAIGELCTCIGPLSSVFFFPFLPEPEIDSNSMGMCQTCMIENN